VELVAVLLVVDLMPYVLEAYFVRSTRTIGSCGRHENYSQLRSPEGRQRIRANRHFVRWSSGTRSPLAPVTRVQLQDVRGTLELDTAYHLFGVGEM